MADDSGTGERTEAATPKKRQDARERGNVLKSQELVMTGSLLIMFAAMRALAPTVATNLMDVTGSFLTLASNGTITAQNLLPLFQQAVFGFFQIMLPILIVAVMAAIILNVVQTGFLFTTKALEIKMDRLNPMEGFKRMFSSRVLFDLLKSIAKVVIVGFIIYYEITSNLNLFPNLMNDNYRGAIQKIAEMVFDAAFLICGALAIVAAMDYFYQRWKYEKDLRMSKYDIKMEYKQQEGDPMIKGKMRQRQREMGMMRMMQSVPEADVVITNPTEYAVALKYDESVGDAPMVLAKGKDLVAQKIKEIAKQSNVSVVENKPLARGIYAYCEVGQFIPVDMYHAVAEILAQIYRTKNK